MILNGILIYYHCRSNTGYAIGRLEPVFFEMAQRLTENISKIHIGYSSLDGGMPTYIPTNFKNIIEFDSAVCTRNSLEDIYNYIKENKIEVAFGFDQPVSRPAYSVMRKAGIKLFVSYMGAPVSSINTGVKLLLKKIEIRLRKNKPDHFIFESQAMADTAVYGRGIESGKVSVIHLGVDTENFMPGHLYDKYAHVSFGIPEDRKIIYYSGHMEERKGVHVIVEAANELIRVRKRNDVHFLFLGNTDGQEKKFEHRYVGSETEKYVTFGGYRNDVNQILSSSHIGVIASTGWDSFTVSSLEMASSGLPLIVSNLQGLSETIDDGKTGYLFEPGNHIELADKIELLLDKPELQWKMGSAARKRIIDKFSREKQIESLVDQVRGLYFAAN